MFMTVSRLLTYLGMMRLCTVFVYSGEENGIGERVFYRRLIITPIADKHTKKQQIGR